MKKSFLGSLAMALGASALGADESIPYQNPYIPNDNYVTVPSSGRVPIMVGLPQRKRRKLVRQNPHLLRSKKYKKFKK